MLNQLVEFGKKIRNLDESDALKQEFVAIDIVIDAEGNFKGFNTHDKMPTRAEALTAKKGKARLLLDKAAEVLGFEAKKHALFLNKLHEYENVAALTPVLHFYGKNRSSGLEMAAAAFEVNVPEKSRKENLAFLILGDSCRLHEKEEVIKAIIAKFEQGRSSQKADAQKFCSICGTADSPILDEPHGMIKKVPDGQQSGSALVSYNEKAFESYNLKGNENSSICAACARNYVEGLNYLLGNGVMCQPEKGKSYMQYSNRKNLAADTAMIYWTQSLAQVPELDLLENTSERQTDIFSLIRAASTLPSTVSDEDMGLLLDSPKRGTSALAQSIEAERFYACILSGAAARISIRSWLETTASAMKEHVAKWFKDTAIIERSFDSKELVVRFFSLRELAGACGIHRKKEQSGSARYELDRDDPFIGRAAVMLWNCALLGKTPPLTLLDRVVRRIRTEEGRVTAARAALLRLILNRNRQWQTTGARRMQTKLDQENTDTSYIAGCIFAVLESIQGAALGNELNASIRDRFFSFAATTPAPAFGRLIKLSQNHLAKLRGDKPGLAVDLDKKLGVLFSKIAKFPPTFSLEEQGQFAIGYYHQRQENFAGSKKTHINDSTTADKGE